MLRGHMELSHFTQPDALPSRVVIRRRSAGPVDPCCSLGQQFDPVQCGWVPADVSDDLGAGAGRATLRLRPWTASDTAAYRRLLSDPELWRFLPEGAPGTVTDDLAAHFLAIAMDPRLHSTRAIEWMGQPVGQVRLTTCAPPELSYWIGRSFRGNGLARRAVAAFLADHADHADHAGPVVASVHPDNAASLRVLKRTGFGVAGPDPRHDGYLMLSRPG